MGMCVGVSWEAGCGKQSRWGWEFAVCPLYRCREELRVSRGRGQDPRVGAAIMGDGMDLRPCCADEGHQCKVLT